MSTEYNPLGEGNTGDKECPCGNDIRNMDQAELIPCNGCRLGHCYTCVDNDDNKCVWCIDVDDINKQTRSER